MGSETTQKKWIGETHRHDDFQQEMVGETPKNLGKMITYSIDVSLHVP